MQKRAMVLMAVLAALVICIAVAACQWSGQSYSSSRYGLSNVVRGVLNSEKPTNAEKAENAIGDGNGEGKKTDEGSLVQPTQDSELEAVLNQVYDLKTKYTEAVDNLEVAAIAEYQALPPEERTEEAKQKLRLKYMQQASELEASCDVQMDLLIARIEIELKKNGGDSTLIENIRSAYQYEKSMKKSYFISKFL